MKEIPLTRGLVAIVDDEDYLLLSKYKWCASVGGPGRFCAARKMDGCRRIELMHRVILGLVGRWPIVDHINGNPLDNRRANLRICSQSENMRNRPAPKSNTSGFKGVYFHRKSGKWHARIMVNYKHVSLGYHETAEQAGAAYDLEAKKYHGEFAKPNQAID